MGLLFSTMAALRYALQCPSYKRCAPSTLYNGDAPIIARQGRTKRDDATMLLVDEGNAGNYRNPDGIVFPETAIIGVIHFGNLHHIARHGINVRHVSSTGAPITHMIACLEYSSAIGLRRVASGQAATLGIDEPL